MTILFVTFSVSGAGEISAGAENEIVKDEENNRHSPVLSAYISHSAEILTAPARWKEKDWFEGALFLTATAGLYSQDEKIRRWTQDNKNDRAHGILEFAKDFGDGRYLLPPLGLLWLYGKGWDDGSARETASLALESFLISGVFTQVLKGGMRRHRPYMEDGRDHWDGPGSDFSGSTLSFPSGHSQTAFSIATVIAKQYRHVSIIPPLAYGMASLVGMQRVYDDKHWASDVFVGSSIGYFTAKKVMALKKDEKRSAYLLMPHFDGEKAGITFLAFF
ncbi:MAG: phosphatase PAP2 family protein [Deltaproteobacteria bacterium]|nr:phosphatase PAP2 family protein [Deltaproteobacteria bacterium]